MFFRAKNGKLWLKSGLLAVVIIGLTIGGYVLYAIVHHNFHTVSPGLVYRSAQMDAPSLADAIQAHDIKSIINLRGGRLSDDWYRAETDTARDHGVKYFDFCLSATEEVGDDAMDKLMTILQTAPKPVLIHCKSGADRTGLVGALYLYGVEGRSASQAKRQLNAFYGHVPFLFWSETRAMDRSYWRYVHNHAPQVRFTPATVAAHSAAG